MSCWRRAVSSTSSRRPGSGAPSVCSELLDADPALIEAWSPDGFQALHLAAFFGQTDAAEALLQRAPIRRRFATPVRQGHAAAQRGRRRGRREPAHRRGAPPSTAPRERAGGGWGDAAPLRGIQRKRRDRERPHRPRSRPGRRQDDGKTPPDLARARSRDLLEIGPSDGAPLLVRLAALAAPAAGCGGGEEGARDPDVRRPLEHFVHERRDQDRLVRLRDQGHRSGRSRDRRPGRRGAGRLRPRQGGTMNFPYVCPGPHRLTISATGDNQTVTKTQNVTSTGSATGTRRSSPSAARRASPARGRRRSSSPSSTRRRTPRQSTRRSTVRPSAHRRDTTRTAAR